MAMKATHELHTQRKSRNVGVGIVLGLFAAVLFGLSAVKVSQTGPTEGFDHVVRPELELRQ